MNTKITKADFKRHFHYEWPKYLFAAFLACFGWYIIFTITNQVLETEELIIFVGACGINS